MKNKIWSKVKRQSSKFLSQLSLFCLFLGVFFTIFNSNLAVFSQNDFNPTNPTPPVIPTFDGAQTNLQNSVNSSILSVSSFNSSILSSSSGSNNSNFSTIISTNSASNLIFSSSSSIFETSVNPNSTFSSSISSSLILPQIEQDNTVRTGGFSTFLTMSLFLAMAFGYKYHTFVRENRGLKTTEKKIKKK